MRIYHKRAEVGEQAILIKDVKNGDLLIPKGTSGYIVYSRGNTKSTIWFPDVGKYSNDPIRLTMEKAFNLTKCSSKNGKVDGLAMQMNREYFGVYYKSKLEFNEILINEDKAKSIPMFDGCKELRIKDNLHIRCRETGEMKPQYSYRLEDIVDEVENNFVKWVEKNTSSREITQEEKDSGEKPYGWDECLDPKSEEVYSEKREEILYKFAEVTGVYVDFTGGLLYE